MEEKKEEKKEENVAKVSSEKNDKVRVGTVGNWILGFFAVIIMFTGAWTYYLIHNEKDTVDKAAATLQNIDANLVNSVDLLSNTSGNENVNTIADIIDQALNTTNTTGSAVTDASNTRKILNEELVVLYDGLILDTTSMDEVTLKYIDNKNDAAEKYVITYYNYENYGFKDSRLGTLSSQIYEGLVKIDNVGKIAISEEYPAIPRPVKVVNTVPTVVLDSNPSIEDYDTVKTLICDVDGNQTDEYILILANKTTGFSKISLVDNKGTKVADLASIEKSKWRRDASNTEYYLSINNIELIDVDNDGIMEIVVEIPHAKGEPTVSLLKYKNGELSGKTGIECSLIDDAKN